MRDLNRIGVFIVDDSAVVRQVVSAVLAGDAGIEIVGVAADPIFALHKMEGRWPDVILLDIEMPRMDGITFLRKLMAERPTPVVICSALSDRAARTTMEALAAGAVDVVAKPGCGARGYLMDDIAAQLIHAVKAAASARVMAARSGRGAVPVAPKLTADAILPPAHAASTRLAERVVAIGTSTGGTQALESVLSALGPDAPGMVIVQHMPEKFTTSFAERLDSLCRISVREARDGDPVVAGLALIAPGGKHMLLKRRGSGYCVDVIDGPVVNRHRPSVDVLFRSVAGTAGRNALGVIMTGMGDDGARGLKEMHDLGAATIAQDESSSVVYGMPKEAVRLGGVDRSLPLAAIPAEISGFSHRLP